MRCIGQGIESLKTFCVIMSLPNPVEQKPYDVSNNKLSLVMNLQNYKHKPSVAKAVRDVIKPVFADLSHPAILKKCLGGKTQNPNESLNSLIWKFCPKTIGSSLQIAEIVANLATSVFNDGNQILITILEKDIQVYKEYMNGGQKTRELSNWKGHLALTVCGERRVSRIVHSQQSQALAQITTQLNECASRTVIGENDYNISRQEDDYLDGASDEMNTEIRSSMVGLKQSKHM
ncbi:uncharacterized protein TNCV_3334471 [Trichonephila clavipes]|nr:uncharacterized protein TNCV_3334471 [Trichonephila clavipes]